MAVYDLQNDITTCIIDSISASEYHVQSFPEYCASCVRFDTRFVSDCIDVNSTHQDSMQHRCLLVISTNYKVITTCPYDSSYCILYI
ncbi:hypothetical protein BLOT_012271 [Blomia tropicalis]|nr:hypothetical protein BLOT_012271 [Blomia tropicalis]